MAERIRPHVNVDHPSPNYSSRGGARPTLAVIHATVSHNRPGVTDLVSLGDFFGRATAQVSSQVATDNEGHSARFVADSMKAWHCANFNRLSLGIEQILPADGTEITADLYRETARWCAKWNVDFGIPLRLGAVEGLAVTRSGVVSHKMLGAAGGGHVDPGPVYDMGHLIALAKHYRSKL